jgi:hypothetical protein
MPVWHRGVVSTTAQEYLAFADGQAAGVSPAYEALARRVAGDEGVLRLLDRLPPGKRQPNLLLAVRSLLGGPLEPDAFAGWVVEHWAQVSAEVLARRTQTNEPSRCATLLPALARLAGPLALLEVGTSAGLCLYPDRYRYDYGAGLVGDGPGPVLPCDWGRVGEAPPTSVPTVVWRAGLDVNPLDLSDPEALAWLAHLVWPEQEARRHRLDEAARLVRDDPPLLVTGDLVDDLPALAARAPCDATLVVVHSAVLGYVDAPKRRRFAELVGELPGHWLANEHPSLVQGLVADPGPPPPRPGPELFVTALDGVPVGWSGPHGQSWD